jgi:hypothetical protein
VEENGEASTSTASSTSSSSSNSNKRAERMNRLKELHLRRVSDLLIVMCYLLIL